MPTLRMEKNTRTQIVIIRILPDLRDRNDDDLGERFTLENPL
jgi:hypothetical protein